MAIFDRKDCLFSFPICYNEIALEPNDYIEYVFIKNFLIDLGLICLSQMLLKDRVKWRYRLLGGCFGGVFGCVYPLYEYPPIVSALLKIISGIVLCLISSGAKSFRKNAYFCLCFFACSILFAGLNALFDYHVLLIPIMSVILLLFCVIFERIVYRRREIVAFTYRCTAVLRGKTIDLNGFLDTGNRVSFKGEPVCILSANVIADLLSSEEPLKTVGKIPICTVNGTKEILLLEFDSLSVYSEAKIHTIKKVKVGLSPNKLSDDYEILLHPSLIEEKYDS